MKKLVLVLMLVFAILLCMASCNFVDGVKDTIVDMIGDEIHGDEGGEDTPILPDDGSNVQPEEPSTPEEPDTPEEPGGDNEPFEPEEPVPSFTYNDFSQSDKATYNSYVGFVIPFFPCDDYQIEAYEEDGYKGVYFSAEGATEERFSAYLLLFNSYSNDGTEVDEDNDTWYLFSNEDVYVDVVFYTYEGVSYVDVDAYYELNDGGEVTPDTPTTPEEPETPTTPENPTEKETTITKTAEQIASNLGSTTDGTIVSGNAIALDSNIKVEFFKGSATTEPTYYNPAIRIYQNGGYLTVSASNGSVIEKIVITTDDGKTGGTLNVTGGTASTSGDTVTITANANTTSITIKVTSTSKTYRLYLASISVTYLGEGGGEVTPDEPSTPEEPTTPDEPENPTEPDVPGDEEAVKEIDFTKATNVKDVTDQGYYLDGCPTTGSPAVLVIPIEFSDVTASSKGYTIDKLKNAFLAGGTNDYYSVYDYYHKSSYGALTLDITVVEEWFRPSKTSSYYASATMDYDGEDMFIGDQMVMDEALAYLAKTMDLSKFDSDNNDIIDAVVLITTLEIDSNTDFNWAYRYWNYYTDDEGYYYEYDNVSANDYLWAPYQFLFEDYDYSGEPNYNDKSVMNTYTFIHEFGHVLGADDYYDTAYVGSPMGGFDVMDSMAGDHNPYTKFNYGWLTSSRLVTGNVTLTLEDFSKNGDTIILANNWNETLGAYQEYYVIAYYTNNGLNDNGYGYFEDEGIVVYHVNATLTSEVYEGETYYDVKNNNTDASDDYGTEDNLIEYVLTPLGDYVYGEGDSLGTVKYDNGTNLGYTFTVEEINGESATISFTKN